MYKQFCAITSSFGVQDSLCMSLECVSLVNIVTFMNFH